MTAALAPRRAAVFGHDKPRIAPPVPARSGYKEFAEFSAGIGLTLRPWQQTVARYLTAEAPDKRWLFREVAVIVARQNGKTAILVPLIIQRLLAGQRIMHTAQNRDLPREVFGVVADIIEEKYAKELPSRRGRVTRPRFANGQEEIRLKNGGVYSIVAPTRGGARGPSRDLVIVDELREMEDFDFIAAAKPTLTASRKPQMVYLSNAGTETSVVLNSLKKRAGEDPAIAYLEWSAGSDRQVDEMAGWQESNPSLGHDPAVEQTLIDELRSNSLAGTISIYETEHLCRWVVTLRERLVSEIDWSSAQVPELEEPTRPFMAVSMDPSGKRAAAAVAWARPDGFGLRLLFDVTGNPIDADLLGKDLRDTARRMSVPIVGFDPLTDAQLAKFFFRKESISASKYANASARFVTLVEGGKVKWTDSAAVGTDLSWTARKPHDETGSFQAVRADDNHPIPAALAAIRALWLASEVRPDQTRKRSSTVAF